jgi:hypothetical protein
MTWVAVAIGGSAIVGGVLGADASKDAAKAQGDASAASIEEQRRQFNTTLRLLDPQRQMGYGAMSDIARLYGWSLPAYQGSGDLLGIGGAGGSGVPLGRDSRMDGNVITVGPHTSGGNDTLVSSSADRMGLGGVFGHGGGYNYAGGSIDPRTGMVTVTDSSPEPYNEALTHYLRTGEWTLDDRKTKYVSTVKSQIDKLRGSGWTWDAQNNRGIIPGAADTVANPTLGGRNESAPGDMSRFFASPDYQFRLSEGNKAIERGAAARGGALSGNAVKAAVDYSGNLASGEYNNYYNKLAAAAGMEQVGTGSAINAGSNYANVVTGLNQAAGDARASGILGQANSITGAANQGLNLFLLQRGGFFNRG